MERPGACRPHHQPKLVQQRKIRLLIVKDREDDAMRIVDQLRREGFDPEWQQVDREAIRR